MYDVVQHGSKNQHPPNNNRLTKHHSYVKTKTSRRVVEQSHESSREALKEHLERRDMNKFHWVCYVIIYS